MKRFEKAISNKNQQICKIKQKCSKRKTGKLQERKKQSFSEIKINVLLAKNVMDSERQTLQNVNTASR